MSTLTGMTAPALTEPVGGNRPPDRPVKPLLRGRSHEYAFVASLTLAPIMIALAPGIGPRFVVAIYVLGITALFGISALYHRPDWGPHGRAVMRRLDHSMIFVAIAATYTPIAVFALPHGVATLVLWAIWIGALAGIVLHNLVPYAPHALIAVPYVVVGLVAVIPLNEILSSLGVAGFVLIITGGVLYTFGALVYALRRPDPWPFTFGYHEIFHLLVIAAAVLQYVDFVFVVLPKA